MPYFSVNTHSVDIGTFLLKIYLCTLTVYHFALMMQILLIYT